MRQERARPPSRSSPQLSATPSSTRPESGCGRSPSPLSGSRTRCRRERLKPRTTELTLLISFSEIVHRSDDRLFTSALHLSSSPQLFFAVLPFPFANGLGALPALIAAQRFFAAAAIDLRAAALIPR